MTRPIPYRYVVKKDGTVFEDEARTIPFSDDEHHVVHIQRYSATEDEAVRIATALHVVRQVGFFGEESSE